MARPDTGVTVYQRFVDEYMARGCVPGASTEAYMATHPASSKKNATIKACKWMSYPVVQKLINEAKLAQQERTQISADKILHELMFIARADISKAFNKDGSLKAIHDIPEDVRRAISGVETLQNFIGSKGGKVQVHKVKFWDKVAALGLLGKNLRLFVDQVELKGTIKTVRVNSNIELGNDGE